jgi:hypothetical protein
LSGRFTQSQYRYSHSCDEVWAIKQISSRFAAWTERLSRAVNRLLTCTVQEVGNGICGWITGISRAACSQPRPSSTPSTWIIDWFTVHTDKRPFQILRRGCCHKPIVWKCPSFMIWYVLKERSGKWLRHYATSRKVAGSRPDEVNEFFQFT